MFLNKLVAIFLEFPIKVIAALFGITNQRCCHLFGISYQSCCHLGIGKVVPFNVRLFLSVTTGPGCLHRQVKSLTSSPAFAVQINASKVILHPDHHSYDQQGLRHATSSLPALWLGRIPTPSRGKNLVLQIPEKSFPSNPWEIAPADPWTVHWPSLPRSTGSISVSTQEEAGNLYVFHKADIINQPCLKNVEISNYFFLWQSTYKAIAHRAYNAIIL